MSNGRPKGGKNRSWTSEEKERLIREYYLSEKGYKIFAKEHGIAHSLFSSWLKKYQENGREGLQHKKRKLPQTKQMENLTESEIQYLKLIIAEQQIQIEKLKRELEKS